MSMDYENAPLEAPSYDDDFGPPESVEVDVNLVINNLQQGWMSQVANLQWVNAQLSAKAAEMERRWQEAEMRVGALEGALKVESENSSRLEEELNRYTPVYLEADGRVYPAATPADDHLSEDAILQMSAALSGQPGLTAPVEPAAEPG